MKKSSKALIAVCAVLAAIGIASISYAIWIAYPREATVEGQTGMLETYGFAEVEHNLSDGKNVWVPYDQVRPIENMVKVWEITVKFDGTQLENPNAYKVLINYTEECAEEMRNCMYFYSGTEPFSPPTSLAHNWTLIKGEDEPQEVKLDAANKIYVVFNSYSTDQMNKKAKLKIVVTTGNGEVNNGDFETGDLSSWTIVGGDSSAVGVSTATEYWAGDPNFYDMNNHTVQKFLQDGEYFLLTDQDKQVTVKSETFTLKGDGIISFKLGVAKNPVCYVALCDASDDSELIKVTNSYFDDPTLAQVLLRRYVYATDYIGREVYIKIVDGATSDFGFIAFDALKVSLTTAQAQELAESDKQWAAHYRQDVIDSNASMGSRAKDIINAIRNYYSSIAITSPSDKVYTIENGDFEKGNLTGWTQTSGNGFAAISDATECWNGVYNKQGSYHLDGWAGADSENGIGTLKSSVFTLGGTGKISFRLGGGNFGDVNSGTYISVKKTDGTEVARFTNTKQQPKDDQGRGEQYMWLYVYDLSQVASLGDDLYIEIVDCKDNGSGVWRLLFVDDIQTYHTEETLATLGTHNTDYFDAVNQSVNN